MIYINEHNVLYIISNKLTFMILSFFLKIYAKVYQHNNIFHFLFMVGIWNNYIQINYL